MLSMVLERTITQIILTFMKSYVKDVQVSESRFWSGDVTFNNLELRLDVLQESIELPIYFTRGFVRRLRLQVPWTNLSREPTVVEIDSIEVCFTTKKAGDAPVAAEGLMPSALDGEDLQQQEGWVESTVKKMIRNLALTVTNVSIK